VSRFRNASAFASWSGLCPENKISGGKVLCTKSRRVTSPVATALRMAANSLHHAKDNLGEFFRRITRKLGKPQAITATAHKLARIVYHLLSTKEAYNETVFHRCDEEALRRAQFRLHRQAAQLGFQVVSHRARDVPWESALLRLSSRAARRSAGISALRRLGRRDGTRSGGYSKFQILMRIPTRVGKQALSVQKIYRSGQIPDDRGFRSNSVSPRPLLVPCRRSPRQLRPRWLRGAGFFRH
jgi:hypothetical protein